MGDDAVKGRGDFRVIREGEIFVHGGLGGGDGGGGGLRVGAGRIEILLRHQIGMLPVDRRQPGENQVGIGVIRLGFLPGRLGVVQFVLQFRHFQRGQNLAGLHPVAEIHLHLADIAGDFGVQGDFLIRAEFRRNHQLLEQVFAGDRHHRRARQVRGIFARPAKVHKTDGGQQ